MQLKLGAYLLQPLSHLCYALLQLFLFRYTRREVRSIVTFDSPSFFVRPDLQHNGVTVIRQLNLKTWTSTADLHVCRAQLSTGTMSGTIQNATTSAFDASKTALAPIIASLHSASALGGKAFLAASGTSYTLLHSLVEKDRTGLLRIAVSRLEAGDKAAWLALGSSVLIGYIGLCNALRFRRRDKMKKELGYYTREEMKNMTTTEAQRVIVNMSEMEFPLVYMTSIEFALFKVRTIFPVFPPLFPSFSPFTMAREQH